MKKNLKRLILYTYIVLLFSIFFSTALSRNSSKISGTSNMEVAGMVINLQTEEMQINHISNTQQNLHFSVNNFNADAVNDIEISYQLSFLTKNTAVPLQYELYQIINGTEEKIQITNGMSETIILPHTTKTTQEFILKISMDNLNFKNIQDILEINLYAEQNQ